MKLSIEMLQYFLNMKIFFYLQSMSTVVSSNFEAFYWNILSSINLLILMSIQKLMTLHDLLRIISGNKKIFRFFSNVHLALHLQKTGGNDFMEFFKDYIYIFHHKKTLVDFFFSSDFFQYFMIMRSLFMGHLYQLRPHTLRPLILFFSYLRKKTFHSSLDEFMVFQLKTVGRHNRPTFG